MTGLTYVTRAMKKVGALDPGRVPTDAEATDGLQTLNNMAEAWALSKSLVWTDQIIRATFATSKQSYTIGPGGDLATDINSVAIPRPTRISWGNIVLTSTTPAAHIPLTLLQTKEWLAIPVPLLAATPSIRAYYDGGFNSTPGVAPALATTGTGTIYFNPYPAAPLPDFEWSQPVQFAAFDLTTDYLFPPGYAQALELSLAEQMLEFAAPEIDKEEIKLQAARARAAIAQNNNQPPRLQTDSGFGVHSSRGGFNWLTGNLS